MPNNPPERDRVAVPFALAILGVWIIVVLWSLYVKDYTGLTIVTPVMILAAGFVFGIKLKSDGSSNGNGNTNNK